MDVKKYLISKKHTYKRSPLFKGLNLFLAILFILYSFSGFSPMILGDVNAEGETSSVHFEAKEGIEFYKLDEDKNIVYTLAGDYSKVDEKYYEYKGEKQGEYKGTFTDVGNKNGDYLKVYKYVGASNGNYNGSFTQNKDNTGHYNPVNETRYYEFAGYEKGSYDGTFTEAESGEYLEYYVYVGENNGDHTAVFNLIGDYKKNDNGSYEKLSGDEKGAYILEELSGHTINVPRGEKFSFLVRVDQDQYEVDGINITCQWVKMDTPPSYSNEKGGYVCTTEEIYVYSTTVEISNFVKKSYNVVMPQKVAGVKTMEYERKSGDEDWVSGGSVSGISNVTLFHGTALRFIISLRDKGYDELKNNYSKMSIKVYEAEMAADGTWQKKPNGKIETYNFEKNTTDEGNLIGFITAAEGGIQITKNVILELDGITKDKHEITFKGVDEDGIENTSPSAATFTSGSEQYNLINEKISKDKIANEGDLNLPEENEFDSLKFEEKSDGTYVMKYIEYTKREDENGVFKYTLIADEDGSIYREVKPDYGTYFEFNLDLKDGYTNSRPQITAKVDGQDKEFEVIKTTTGFWRLKVSGNTNLSVGRVEKNKYKISMTDISGVSYKYATLKSSGNYGEFKDSAIVNHGDNVKIRVYVDEKIEGLDINTLNINAPGVEKISKEAGTEKEHYEYKGAGKGDYNITFTEAENGKYSKIDEYYKYVGEGGTHNILSIEETQKGQGEYSYIGERVYYEYTLENVTSDVNAVVTISKIEYTVSLNIDTDENTEINDGDNYSDVAKFYNIYGNKLSIISNKSEVGSAKIEHGSNFQFTIDVGYKYSQSEAQDMAVYYVPINSDGKTYDESKKIKLTALNGVYTVQSKSGVKDDNEWKAGKIVIEGLKLNRQKLEFQNEKDKYSFSDIKITENIKSEDKIIEIKSSDEFESSKVIEVKYGSTCEFNLNLHYGYSMDGLEVTANDVALRKEDGKYVLKNISEDYLIKVSNINEAKYQVEFPSDAKGLNFIDSDGNKVNVANVNYKNQYKFKIKYEKSYSDCENNENVKVYVVPVNDEKSRFEIKLDEGEYRIPSVEENLKIVVEGVKINTNTVTLPATPGIKYEINYTTDTDDNNIYLKDKDENMKTDIIESGNYAVIYGNNFYFKVIPDEAHDITDISISCGNGSYADELKDGYVIQGVKSNLTLEVLGVKDKMYNVTFVREGVEFYPNLDLIGEIVQESVAHQKGVLEFIVSLKEGYSIAGNGNPEFSLKNALTGETSKAEIYYPTASNIKYRLTNVTEDIILEITNIEILKQNVILPIDQEGIEFYGEKIQENELESIKLDKNNEVNYGSNFVFEIRAKEGYDLSQIEVTAGENRVSKRSSTVNESVYVIESVKSDLTVNIENVNRKKYNLRLNGDNLTFYDGSGNNVLVGNPIIEHENGSFDFRVAANTGYNIQGGLKFYEIKNLAGENGEIKEIRFPVKVYDSSSESGDSSSFEEGEFSEIRLFRSSAGVYTITNVTEHSVILAEGAVKNKYTLTFMDSIFEKAHIYVSQDGKEYKNEINLENKKQEAEYLSELYINVVPKQGYNISSVNLEIEPFTGAEVVKIAEGYYKIGNIVDNVYVSINGVELNEYDVMLKSSGVDFYTESGTAISNFKVKHGESDTFVIQAKGGYDLLNGYKITITDNAGESVSLLWSDEISSVAIKDAEGNDGTKIEEIGRYKYKLSNVQSDITVTVEDVGKNEYSVYLPSNIVGIEFYDINDKQIVEGKANHGESFTFKAVAQEGYNVDNITVTANSQLIELIEGTYTIENVTNDITVNVEGVIPTQVSLRFKYVSGVTYQDLDGNEISSLSDTKIPYDSTFNFKIVLNEAYNQSIDKMKVESDKGNLTFSRGIYTLSNVVEDTNITVSDVSINTYSIALTEGAGYYYLDSFGQVELKGNQTIEYGANFSFMVGSKDGYNISGIKVTAKGEGSDRVELNPVDGVYTIPSLSENYVIIVENAVISTYKVEMRLTDGVNLLDTSGNSMGSQITVNHGSDLSFKLSLGESYAASVPTVSVKGRSQTVEPVNGVYTVNDIRSDIIIEVTGVVKNTYTITLQKTEGVIYKNTRNKVIEGSVEVEWNETFAFRVSLMDAYDASTPVVMVDDKLTLVENGGMYELPNVTGNKTISVRNVKQNAEEAVIGMVLNLPEKVKDMNDAQSVIMASRGYMALSEEEKKLVTNLSQLRNLQDEAAEILHTSNGVTVGDIDWYIKVIVTPLDGDPDSMQKMAEKVDRKSILSLYEIKLWDTLRDEQYTPPSDISLTVVIPAPNLTGYKNEVIVHEKSSGNIEYLDVLINNGYAQFEATSFSTFGIAAKKIPNYVESPSDITISVDGLIPEDAIKKLLVDGDIMSSISSGSSGNNSSGNDIVENKDVGNLNSENGFIKLYNWALENEFLVSIIMILLFSVLIIIIITKGRKKEKNNN